MNLTDPLYSDPEAARQHLEALHWPEGPVCPHCGCMDHITKLQGRSTRPGVYKCNDCEKPFTVTVGTVMEDSKIPLNKWLMAFALVNASKKGISAHQLHRMLGITYKSAWFLAHRIREFDFRYNTRTITDAERTAEAVKGARGKRLMYRQPDRLAA